MKQRTALVLAAICAACAGEPIPRLTSADSLRIRDLVAQIGDHALAAPDSADWPQQRCE